MKSQFNSKMSNSPFYIGPSVYVEKSDWTFIKKENNSMRFVGMLVLVGIISLIVII